jgi:hypothetical protein
MEAGFQHHKTENRISYSDSHSQAYTHKLLYM